MQGGRNIILLDQITQNLSTPGCLHVLEKPKKMTYSLESSISTISSICCAYQSICNLIWCYPKSLSAKAEKVSVSSQSPFLRTVSLIEAIRDLKKETSVFKSVTEWRRLGNRREPADWSQNATLLNYRRFICASHKQEKSNAHVRPCVKRIWTGRLFLFPPNPSNVFDAI